MRRTLILAFVLAQVVAGATAFATDISGPRSFTPIQPCRLVDTRRSDAAYPPPYGAPGFTAGEQRTIPLIITSGTNPCANAFPNPAFPFAGVSAIAANFTVVAPAGTGDLRVGPGSATPTSSIVNFSFSTIANSASVAAYSTNGPAEITLKVVGSPANIIVDVFGYYSLNQNQGNPNGAFQVGVSNGTQVAVNGSNVTTTGQNVWGVLGTSFSIDSGSAGVMGFSGNSTLSANGLGPAGVLGKGPIGVGADGSQVGVQALSEADGGTGVLTRDYGSTSDGKGIDASSFAGTGVVASGGLAPIRLVPAASGSGAPSTGTHQMGELYVDSVGALFYCRVAGTPGTWVTIAP
jgi:hypothetical protein